MKIISRQDLAEAAECLRKGGLVAFPTETVYGLGANALDSMAIARIFEAKQRPTFDPLIVHISDIEQLNLLYEKPVDPLVFRLAEKFMPGPLTIVYKKSSIVPDLISLGLDTVAVRMPAHQVAHQLIEMAGVPVAAPSANRFGQLSPTSYKHVAKQKMKIDYLIAADDTENLVGIESTVVLVERNSCTILRPGIITLDDISKALPDTEVKMAVKNDKINSPGLLNSHYSPLKPLYFLDAEANELPLFSGLILHHQAHNQLNAHKVFHTSDDGNMLEIAANLFNGLHLMEDDDQIRQIFIEPVAENGIGISIMDRLKKATYQYRNH